jgi:hypothetical protein
MVLGAFARIMKGAYYLRHICLAVGLSACMKQLGSHFMDCWSFTKIYRKKSVLVKIGQKYLTQMGFSIVSRSVFCSTDESTLGLPWERNHGHPIH